MPPLTTDERVEALERWRWTTTGVMWGAGAMIAVLIAIVVFAGRAMLQSMVREASADAVTRYVASTQYERELVKITKASQEAALIVEGIDKEKQRLASYDAITIAEGEVVVNVPVRFANSVSLSERHTNNLGRADKLNIVFDPFRYSDKAAITQSLQQLCNYVNEFNCWRDGRPSTPGDPPGSGYAPSRGYLIDALMKRVSGGGPDWEHSLGIDMQGRKPLEANANNPCVE